MQAIPGGLAGRTFRTAWRPGRRATWRSPSSGSAPPAVTQKIALHLDRFVAFFVESYGHDRISTCLRRDVLAWQQALVDQGLAPATVNNHLASLSAFTTWVAAQAPTRLPGRRSGQGRPRARPAAARTARADAGAGALAEEPLRPAGALPPAQGPALGGNDRRGAGPRATAGPGATGRSSTSSSRPGCGGRSCSTWTSTSSCRTRSRGCGRRGRAGSPG